MAGTDPYITLTTENIASEHICCAFSDKKCAEGYRTKKDWLTGEFGNGLVFRRLDQRAKVFIEYGPAETAWIPVHAPDYFIIGCLWVSGQYKGKGHAKALLESAWEDAARQGKNGLVAVTGDKKFPFMGDGKWFKMQGFEEVQKLPGGFVLWVKKLKEDAPDPAFLDSVLSGESPEKEGVAVYYSNR